MSGRSLHVKAVENAKKRKERKGFFKITVKDDGLRKMALRKLLCKAIPPQAVKGRRQAVRVM